MLDCVEVTKAVHGTSLHVMLVTFQQASVTLELPAVLESPERARTGWLRKPCRHGAPGSGIESMAV